MRISKAVLLSAVASRVLVMRSHCHISARDPSYLILEVPSDQRLPPIMGSLIKSPLIAIVQAF